MASPFIEEWEEGIPTLEKKFEASLWEGESPFEEIPMVQQFTGILTKFGKMFGNLQEKTNKNADYANRLGWSKYIGQISELLLKSTGQSNQDHTSAHFAVLVAKWQEKNGFSGKDVDGIIGPNTWKRMWTLLGLSSVTTGDHSSVNAKTVAKVQEYSALIERISKELDFNPNIVKGIIAAESGGNRYSGQGSKGYKGLMQAKRDTDQFDPETSIRNGIGVFKEMRDRNLGPRLAKLGIDKAQIDDETFLRLVLCSYNAGHVSVLKALSYAKENGNWRDWFEGAFYKRGLLFTGAYSKYSKCGTQDMEKATKDASYYRFKRGVHWMKQPDPPIWEEAIKIISPLLKCWIDTKHGNTPGYLNKIIGYFKYFESLGATQELRYEDESNFHEAEFDNDMYPEFENEIEPLFYLNQEFENENSMVSSNLSLESEEDNYQRVQSDHINENGFDNHRISETELDYGEGRESKEVDWHDTEKELAFENELIFDENNLDDDMNDIISNPTFHEVDFDTNDLEDEMADEIWDEEFEGIEDDYELEFSNFENGIDEEEEMKIEYLINEDVDSELEVDFEDEIEYEELYDDELEAEMLLDYEFSAKKEPLAIPVDNPVSFAPIPKQGSFWPLISSHPRGKEVPFQYQTKPSAYAGNASRSFLARRADGNRYHVGIDLYANNMDRIVACEDGVIVNFYHFYRSTYALIVEHENIVINYGEVHSDSLKANKLKVGDRVRAGQVIGIVGKMYKSSMLHFETYRKGTTKNIRWLKKDRAPYNILNPTKYLLFLQQHGKISNGEIGKANLPSTSIPTVGSNLSWKGTIQDSGDIITGVLDNRKLIEIAIAEISKGQQNENIITNTLFYAKYPSKKGQKLQPQDPLAKDWIILRNTIVRPLLKSKSNPTLNTAPSGPLIGGDHTNSTVGIRVGGWGGWKGKSSVGTTKIADYLINDSVSIAIAVASSVEGTFDKVNMYDRGILSWGIKQWTAHAGSLQGLLAYIIDQLRQKGQSPLWDKLFPGLGIMRKNLTYNGREYPITKDNRGLMQLLRGSSDPQTYDDRVIDQWVKMFAIAGRNKIIQELQFEYAKRQLTLAMNRNLGDILKFWKSRFKNFDPQNYGKIGLYLGNNNKSISLFNGMLTQNPKWTYFYLKNAIDIMISNKGSSNVATWNGDWNKEFGDLLEKLFINSGVACWGSRAINSKKQCKGRTSRTTKLLRAFAIYQGMVK